MKIEYDDKHFTEEELENTPKRRQRYAEELRTRREFEFKTFDSEGYDQLIILKDIDFSSECSHHLLPFIGKVHIGYIPDKKICGLSKLARITDAMAARPQIQERLTHNILDELIDKLTPIGAMVVIEARHDCMCIRGVKKLNSVMITSAIYGAFKKPEVRSEFLKLIRG